MSAQSRAAEAPPHLTKVLALLREHLLQLAERYHIRSLAIFGSYARDEQTPESDLDILVEFDSVPTLFTYAYLEGELTRILNVRVDLVMKEALKPAIGRRILEEVVPV